MSLDINWFKTLSKLMTAINHKFHILCLIFIFQTLSSLGQASLGIIRCGHSYLDSIHKTKQSKFNRLQFEKEIAESIQKQKSKKTGALSSSEIINIPVVVHVIHDNISGTVGGPLNSNISDDQIISQINVLNEDFRRLNPDTINTPIAYSSIAGDARIEFCMATRAPDGTESNGITRTYTDEGPFDINDANTLADIINWPTDEYLNIWVCELSGGFLGFAQFPDDSGLSGLGSSNGDEETDGIVIHHENFGNRTGTATGLSPYTYGRTTTHEVGHWLGLLHIWGDAASGVCGTDHVDDTPVADFENYGCDLNNITCLSRDMVENYMDYTDDQCMNIFTNDQISRMRAVFDVSPRRVALLSSPGCCGAGVSYKIPFQETFESNEWIETIGWDTNDVDNDGTWERSNYGAYGESFSSISIVNNGSTYGNIDFLETPIIDLRKAEYPILSFDYAYSANGNTTTDSIVISYETTCDDEWTNLMTLTGNDLITSTTLGNPLIPTADDWKNYSAQFNQLSNLAVVTIRIENYSKGINTVYIDNFHIYKTLKELAVCLYPNPAHDVLTIDTGFDGDQDIEVEIYTSLGQLILSEKRLDSKSRLLKFETSTLVNGMYLVRIKVDNQIVVKKFVIQNP